MNPSAASPKPQDAHPLDAITGGAFSAPTSGERASRVRDWLATEPAPELLQEVFKELSARDKGAARAVREKLDEQKRARTQEAIGAEWAQKAQALLDTPRLNIADAMAWQRDAARAGAPLSREPLATLRTQLAERVKSIEDLHHRVQVQREAAVLLAQRIEVLSTKNWQDAQAVSATLAADVPAWQAQADALVADPGWPSVDSRFPPQLDASRAQLQVVWDAFNAALAQAVAAAADPAAPLPAVPVWADQLRAARGEVATPEVRAQAPARPKTDPAVREKAVQAVRSALDRLAQEVAQGHGKASTGAAQALRQVLKEHGRHIDDKLEAEVNAQLVAAGELEGWQRWRADQIREELVAKAEALVPKAVAAPAVEGEDAAAPAAPAPAPRMGGRKMQETLRNLREQWKQTDQGGAPNHALWKRFDEACNEAHKVVEAWLEKSRAEASEHKAQRLALIEEVRAWTEAQAGSQDWRGMQRALHRFAERWRESGHLSEKAFAELQPQWKAAIAAAHVPLETAQKDSVARRQALIEEATALGAQPQLRIDAVKALQQRWQAEAQSVPLERRHEQKLWDAFRKPIDQAFERKGAEREKQATALSARDRAVLDASKALEAASASGDAQRIREAMAALDAAMRAQAAAVAAAPAAPATGAPGAAAPEAADATAATPATTAAEGDAPAGPEASEVAAEAAAPAPAPKPAKPVVAVRGDDRPGMKKAEPAAPMRGGRPAGRGGRDDARGGDRGAGRGFDRDRGPRMGRPDFEDRGPRLGDAAFRAQRDAVERAQGALRKLAAQAHGEALTQLLSAWEQRAADQVPSVQELGRSVTPAVRGSWTQALGAAPTGDAGEALLRLEMAAEVPTPADQIQARRALQLQLLTRRNDPSPAQTWGQDAARVLASAHEASNARRLQNALKALLK